MCRYKQKDGKIEKPVHYTSLKTLKCLLTKNEERPGKLRLWNTNYMNDPNEGKVFLEMMEAIISKNEKNGENEVWKNYFSYLDRIDFSSGTVNNNVYIISLSKKRDNIYMWNSYADGSNGCAITFADDFFDIRCPSSDFSGSSEYTDSDYPLYEVKYIQEKWRDKDEEKELRGHLLGIWNNIVELEKDLKETGQELQKEVRRFVVDRLNEIRFLFKYSEYENEGELRVVQYSNEPKIEEEAFPIPRLYIEVERDVRAEEVCLGSKNSTSQIEELVPWLYATKKVEKVSKSKRNYR